MDQDAGEQRHDLEWKLEAEQNHDQELGEQRHGQEFQEQGKDEQLHAQECLECLEQLEYQEHLHGLEQQHLEVHQQL